MSTCPRKCAHDRNIFIFSESPASFQEAKDRCKQNGGTLAGNLDLSSYSALLECCSVGQSSYWIGLENVAASKCDNRNSPGFQWIGSRTCSDGSPLNIKVSHVNNKECKAVTIQTRGSDTNRNVPSARVENCKNNNNNNFYICQTAKQNRNPKLTTTTMKKPTRTQTTSYKNSELSTITSTTTSRGSSFNKTKISTTLPTKKTGSDSIPNVWAIAGLLATCSLLLFLAAFLIYRRQNKRFLSKKINCFHMKKNKKNVIDEVYNEWV